jgi:hypothetical protein
VIIRCGRCGAVIGSRRDIVYGGEYGDDHIDYGDLKPGDNYGGEYDGEDYCDECFDELVRAETDDEEDEL